MKLLDLYLNGFGKFHGRNISFQNGLNIVYGKNEAGKSTIHTFIKGMLFGIERGRGVVSKDDLYTRFEPWENSDTYEGQLRLEHKGHIYRLERTFQNSTKEFKIIDESIGREVAATKAFMDELLYGLSETAYSNTISIGQLKCATNAGMAAELKNYISNLNTTGNMALNITKASSFLKNQKKELDAQMVPEAARTYTSLLSEIRNIEKEIASPEFENQIPAFQNMRTEVKSVLEEKQQDKEEQIKKAARGRQVLTIHQFTDEASILAYSDRTQIVYDDYKKAKSLCEKKSPKVFTVLSFLLATLLLLASGFLYFGGQNSLLPEDYQSSSLTICVVLAGVAIFCYLIGLFLFMKKRNSIKELEMSSKVLQEVFSRHLGDSSVSEAAMNAFHNRIQEFIRLNSTVTKQESDIQQITTEIDELQTKQVNCSEVIEKQQKYQWELERKLEHLSNCKTQAEALKHILSENERIREEISAIDLALETITSLSLSIRDSFGLYLNKTASELITGITGGIYNSMSVDENLNISLNTNTRLVPLEQVSSGTMDQVYLALRLASAKLIQGDQDMIPLIFDDSFVLYDEDRLKTALKWLVKAYKGQIIIFTCHQREAQMLTANLIPYHLIEI